MSTATDDDGDDDSPSRSRQFAAETKYEKK